MAAPPLAGLRLLGSLPVRAPQQSDSPARGRLPRRRRAFEPAPAPRGRPGAGTAPTMAPGRIGSPHGRDGGQAVEPMSRGLGRWQRILLHELYHNPKPARPFLGVFNMEPYIRISDYTSSESEDSAARRAARGLVKRGLALPDPLNGLAYKLVAISPLPDISCPTCGRKCSDLWNAVTNSEHLQSSGRQ